MICMIGIREYMKKVGVTKLKYVDEWIDSGLIPGAVRDGKGYHFPDSARRPYRDPHLKPGIPADKIRAHIIKAALTRRHITAKACYMSDGEFDTMIGNLADAGLLIVRTEDGIQYYDSTEKTREYLNSSLKEIGKFVQSCLSITAKGFGEGVASGAIKTVMSKPVNPAP